jgi:glycine/D-amino acid oxidase-like deaminating enzyme
VLSARRACAAVRDAFVGLRGVYHTANVTPGRIEKETMSRIHVSGGPGVEAEVYVFACGPWLGKLFPLVLGDRIRPSRQDVHFFGTPAGSEQYLPANLPVWIDFGERIFYGVPDTHGRGFKIADDTRGEDVDPTMLDRTPSVQSITRARRVLAERFRELANAPLLESRVCQYENSPDGHLIIDRYPLAKNVWIAGGGSGHGFKLAPAVGELAAQAILNGREIPAQFRLERLRDVKKPATQFDERSHS